MAVQTFLLSFLTIQQKDGRSHQIKTMRCDAKELDTRFNGLSSQFEQNNGTTCHFSPDGGLACQVSGRHERIIGYGPGNLPSRRFFRLLPVRFVWNQRVIGSDPASVAKQARQLALLLARGRPVPIHLQDLI